MNAFVCDPDIGAGGARQIIKAIRGETHARVADLFFEQRFYDGHRRFASVWKIEHRLGPRIAGRSFAGADCRAQSAQKNPERKQRPCEAKSRTNQVLGLLVLHNLILILILTFPLRSRARQSSARRSVASERRAED